MQDTPPDQNSDISADGNNAPIQGVNAGGNAVVVAGNYVIHPSKPATAERRRRNEQILLKAVRAEVRDRLSQSLHNALFINLPKESQPDQVQRPWDYELKVGSRKSEPLPSEQTVVDVFDAEKVDNKLLILGQPGAGKTTTLLDLAQTLLARAEKSVEAAIPVLFNLSSWVEDKQSIADWLKGELKLKYGVSQKLGQQWLEQQRLLPLLDGLDELAPARQELCVERINQWLVSDAGRGALVVCSRIEEYENYEAELALRGAVCLQPLSDGQIERYLQEVGKPELQAALPHSAALREMMRVPLQMSMAVLVYDAEFGRQWQQLRTEAERLSALLEAYVVYMLYRELKPEQLVNVGYGKTKSPSVAKTQRWLARLSRQLKQESRDEFLIEQMQPTLLTTAWLRCAYQLIVGPLFGLVVGGILGIAIGLIFEPFIGLISGLIIGLLIGSVVGFIGGLIFGLVTGVIRVLIGRLFELLDGIKPGWLYRFVSLDFSRIDIGKIQLVES